MPSVLVDSGVWYALCDRRDGTVEREVIDNIYDRVRVHTILAPWPVLYETLGTRFMRSRPAMKRFEQEIRSPRIVLLDDAPYRDDALRLALDWSLRRGRALSLVDCVLRLLLDDVQTRIQYLVTFNQRDFVDVCTARRIELWSR